MAGGCCGGCAAPTDRDDDRAWRRVLWIALAINAGMFGVEIVAGVAAHSASLKADALDFLGDTSSNVCSSYRVKGWHDLGVWVAGGGITAGYEARVRFDGHHYPSNPTAPPAARSKDKAGKTIIGALPTNRCGC